MLDTSALRTNTSTNSLCQFIVTTNHPMSTNQAVLLRLATIRTTEGPRLHVRGGSGYVDVSAATKDSQLATLNGLLAAGPAAMDRVRELESLDGREVTPDEFDAVTPNPNRILCIGVNYSDHAIETGRIVPSWPESFMRSASSVLPPFADLVRPALSAGFDYEGELAIVIGTGGRYIPVEKALSAIAGFTVLNEATARDWQRAGTQWLPGKNFDRSMPIGPEMVTPDEVDVLDIEIKTTLNDVVMQQARTSQMLVNVLEAVEFFSSFTELRPGDVIASGTPGGVGFARTPPVWLNPGDTVEVSIEGVGTIRNRVVAEEGAPANWRWLPKSGATGSL
jgi:acylpyruvate hydrolase